jgi:hypothetical protein
MTPTFTPSSAPERDGYDLIALVAELERSQQQEDVEGFLALFAPTAVWVNGAGSPTYLWSRADGTWKIVAGQNTAVSGGR